MIPNPTTLKWRVLIGYFLSYMFDAVDIIILAIAMPAITAEGMSVVIVEQDISMAQKVSQRLYCLQEGRVSLSGASSELSREAIGQAYFGV